MDWQIAWAELQDFGRVCVERGLVVGRAGNLSIRLNEEEFVISRRGARLDRLTPTDLVVCSLTSGTWRGEAHPSIETPMHRAIYLAQPQAQAILHSSPFYATLVACSDIELSIDLIPESMAYLSNIGRVPYSHPGTEELARATAAQAEHNVIILENHGLVVWGQTLEETVQVSEMMERLCGMLVFGKLGEGVFRLRRLGDEVKHDFLEYVRYAASQR